MIQCVSKRITIAQCDRYYITAVGFIVKCKKRLIKLPVAIFNKSAFISARNLISPLRCFPDKNCYFCWFIASLRRGKQLLSSLAALLVVFRKKREIGLKTFTASHLHTLTADVIVARPRLF